MLFNSIKEIDKITWDKFDLKENFKSLEEKKADAWHKIKNGFAKDNVLNFWSGFPIEVIIQASKDGRHRRASLEESLKNPKMLRFLKDELGITSVRDMYKKV